MTLFFDFANRGGIADGDQLSAANSGTGAEVEDLIGGAHRVFVVFHYYDRVALIAEPLERCQQPVVIARVQANRRFVENVEHADQSATDLAGEPNPLRFAARERRCRPIERQVVEPDVRQEAEPSADLLEHLRRDNAAR